MVISPLALIVCVLGLIVWFAVSNSKLSEAGKWMFIAGLFAFLMLSGTKTVHF